jgi:hypothetical protein
VEVKPTTSEKPPKEAVVPKNEAKPPKPEKPPKEANPPKNEKPPQSKAPKPEEKKPPGELTRFSNVGGISEVKVNHRRAA